MDGECLGCGTAVDYSDGECPSCGWNPEEFREQGRHGLEQEGHGEPDDAGSGGPPPGPDSVARF